ncbi:MAG TPA: hypothetical protein PKJ37_00075 [Acidobacteriota bacterium]|nr:hypothetical protein [Acidobacteriota bacterium]HNT16275.1 hypothetical protein [Acidobacteriota bacterium]
MPHRLENEYGLSANELLDAIDKRFRAKVTLEGAVAEVHLGKHIKKVKEASQIHRYEVHDRDGYPDYTLWISEGEAPAYRVECKNVRDSDEAYREGGKIVAYKVETQKTRASKADASSRFYGVDQFEILAVCLGKKTHDWTQFMYIQTKNLKRHDKYRKKKLAVMHPVPLPTEPTKPPWYNSLEALLKDMKNE